jgi:hypothetical protein
MVRQKTSNMLSSNASLQNRRPDFDPVHATFDTAINETSDSAQAADNEQRQA